MDLAVCSLGNESTGRTFYLKEGKTNTEKTETIWHLMMHSLSRNCRFRSLQQILHFSRFPSAATGEPSLNIQA